jgi:hypothetical protein
VVTLYKIDGTIQKIPIPVDPAERLALMQKCVDGFIEMIHHHKNQIYLGNEEGRLLKLPTDNDKFIACTLSANCQLIVSDDKHLLIDKLD